MTKKDFFKSSFVLLAAGLTMTAASCTNEDENSVTPDEKGLIPVEIRSGISGGRTALDGTDVVFQNGDKLAVWDADKHEFTTTGSGSMAVFKGTLNASTPTGQTLNILYPYSAGQGCTSGTITATIPVTQTATENTFDPKANLSVATADYTKGQNVTCTLQNVCGLLKFTIANDAPEDSYDSILIAGKNGENIAGTVTINTSAENPAATGGNAKTITLKGALTKGCTYCIALMPQTFTADGLVMTFYKGTDNVGEAKIVKKDGSALKISPGVILNAGEVKPVKPEPPVCGPFTVGMDGTTPRVVKFAPGNLYCKDNGSSATPRYTFAFEEKQYYFRSYKNQTGAFISGDTYISSKTCPSNTSGLFAWIWSTYSGTNATIAKSSYGAFYDSTTSVSGDASDISLFNSSSNAEGEALKSNFELNDKHYRLLTSDEWKYLLDQRTLDDGTTDCARYAKAKVHNMPGLLIIPDGIEVTGTTAEVGGVTISDVNKLSISAWTSAQTIGNDNWDSLEGAGCVFLPCAGNRNGNAVSNAGSGGGYWSASAGAASSAYIVYFDSGSVGPRNSVNRNNGRAVRLVRVSE